MTTWMLTSLVAFPLALMGCGLVTSQWADRHAVRFRRWVTWCLAGQFTVASLAAVQLWLSGLGAVNILLGDLPASMPFDFSLYYDGVSSLMFALVSFVGWIVCQYSQRYLAGQPTQGRYFRWTAFTLGSVSLLVISGNAILFVGFWIATSFGLHHLLVYYPNRAEAQRVAWTKFTFSRIGDIALLLAIGLAYSRFGTLEFAELFATASNLASGLPTDDPQIMAMGWALVIGAAIKSAQFPFHSWLPLSIETPTPVSALMHAGIVNAGGYLVIRWSPVISLTPSALVGLTIAGTITACVAALIMLTQTSQKRALAYSTVAQMGFMMLQCGLGAYSAAMLHLVAHSLYKAFAFLNSGSVLEQRVGTIATPSGSAGNGLPWLRLGLAGLLTLGLYASVMQLLGMGPASKPGGFALGLIFCAAMTHWFSQRLAFPGRGLQLASGLILGGLTLCYGASFWAIDKIVSSNPLMPQTTGSAWLLTCVVACGFGGLFVYQSLLARSTRPVWLDALQIHFSNGLYIDAWLRRLLTGITTS